MVVRREGGSARCVIHGIHAGPPFFGVSMTVDVSFTASSNVRSLTPSGRGPDSSESSALRVRR